MRAFVWAGLALAVAGCAHAPPLVSSFAPRPCLDAAHEGRVRCGTISVPENYDAPRGRTIELNVAIIPASSPTGAPPLYFIDGGPGDAATRRINYYLNEGAGYRRTRDVVLFDMRGTGRSNPLHCPEVSFDDDPAHPMYPPGAVARCRETLSATADLTQYNTDSAAHDLELVRATLGHERIDLYAASYGTTLSMYYMGAHPARVHAAVLIGAAPWSAMPPQQHAVAAERALRLVMADCAADAACHAAFPDLDGDLRRVLARLPMREGSPRRDMFMETLRRQMYATAGARGVPAALHRVAENGLPADEPPSGRPLPAPDALTFAEGMYLSVTCAESISRMDYERAAAAARATSFNDYRLSQQRAACADWRSVRASDREPALERVRAPVLLVSGWIDPVTPPVWAEETARRLPHARQVIIPAGGHINRGLSGIDTCFDPLLQRFYETLDPVGLDASCLAEMRPPAFTVN